VDKLIEFAINRDDSRAWYVLSYQKISEGSLNKIRERFSRGEMNPNHACKLFYRQGNEAVLEILLDDEELLFSAENCSKAVGGIISRVEPDDETIGEIVNLIVQAEDETAVMNLLYGIWRNQQNRPDEHSKAHQLLVEFLDGRSNHLPTLVDDYLTAITGRAGFEITMNRRSQDELYENVQLAVVTASALAQHHPDNLDVNHVNRLLNHPNAHVAIQTLQSLKQIQSLEREWLVNLEKIINHYPDNPETVITYIELLHQHDIDIRDYVDFLRTIGQENPYLKDRTLELFSYLFEADEFLELIGENMQTEGIEAMRAAQALENYVEASADIEIYRNKIREMLLYALDQQNRSVLSVSEALFLNEDLFGKEDLGLFQSSYEIAKMQHNRSVQETLAQVVEHYGGTIDDPVTEFESKPFRMPDWDKLREFDDNPAWILETEKGDIVVELYLPESPFTVSSIFHLTENGFYDDVVFHRVVRNFVIQGGDFDRRDGFGGPDYRIPTEPSFRTFKRGMAGMASSGLDTEGSQFFFTHTWTPHLDGLYTIFGEVVEGMDVVDTIQIGDMILRARIE